MARALKDYFVVTLKGMGMGAADVVPGVSGGTIAFITGIYEELINTIKSIQPSLLKDFKNGGIKAIWYKVNAPFLIALLLGIGISIASLSRVILYLLQNHPIPVWAFFFGLILASAYLVAAEIDEWNLPVIVATFIGTSIAYTITIISPAETPTDLWFIFICGAIAICAMILPGISGSFILLLMGKYEYIFTTLKEFNIAVIITFALGCVTGILSFSHILSWMFKKYKNVTIALLAGFMIGSLNKVWPWKEVLMKVTINGKEKILQEGNLLPAKYTEVTGMPNQLWLAIALFVFGIVLSIGIERFGKINKSH
jgi:putative membrane protein